MAIRNFLLVLTLTLLWGCTAQGVKYEASSYNVREVENNLNNSIAVGKFTRDESEKVVDPWSFRGATKVKSPVGDGHHDFIAKAIEDELLLARRLDNNSELVLTGNLSEHIVDASGMKTGEGRVAMRFVLESSDQVTYDATKKIQHKWDSAFTGVTAANNATRAYLVMIQKLINSLFQDRQFAEAVNEQLKPIL